MKTPKKKADEEAQFCFRVKISVLEKYRKQAEAEGFRTMTAWLVWHMEKACREGVQKK